MSFISISNDFGSLPWSQTVCFRAVAALEIEGGGGGGEGKVGGGDDEYVHLHYFIISLVGCDMIDVDDVMLLFLNGIVHISQSQNGQNWPYSPSSV